MRLLSSALPTGQYSTAQLTTALTNGALAVSPRFELLDQTLTRIGDLSTVTSGAVTMNVDRAVKGSLDMTLVAGDPLLPFSVGPFTRYVKPYFRILMPDGGLAEWPQGVFVVGRPKRTVTGQGVELWQYTLGDRGYVMLSGGPGIGGYTIAAGVKVTDAIVQTFQTIFGSSVDVSNIVGATSIVASALTWDLAADAPPSVSVSQPISAKNLRPIDLKATLKASNGGNNGDPNHPGTKSANSAAPAPTVTSPTSGATSGSSAVSGTNGTTWADILEALHAAIGYYSPFFNATGAPVSKPMPNLATATADAVYASGSSSILVAPVTVEDQVDSIANRVICRSKNASPTAPYGIATADLNTLIPTHPYAQQNIGFYIDAVVDDTVAGSLVDLAARAQLELYTRAQMYNKVGIVTQAWPVHEAFDVIGVQWSGDSDFDTQRTLQEREWKLNLFTGETARTLRRIVP